MEQLLDAVRDVLVADGTLTAIVAAADIRVMFTEKDINYPTIAIWFGQGLSPADFSNVFRGVVQITIWSQVNILQLHTVHNRIKTLLHNQETTIGNADMKVHSFRFSGGTNWDYYQTTRTWRMVTTYSCLAEDV